MYDAYFKSALKVRILGFAAKNNRKSTVDNILLA